MQEVKLPRGWLQEVINDVQIEAANWPEWLRGETVVDRSMDVGSSIRESRTVEPYDSVAGVPRPISYQDGVDTVQDRLRMAANHLRKAADILEDCPGVSGAGA